MAKETKQPKDLAEHFKVIFRPIITEKALAARGPYERDRKGKKTEDRRGEYAFYVNRNANKVQIAKAVSAIFDVQVDKVRTLIEKGKSRRVRFRREVVPPQKKAYVLLKEGDSIEYMS